MAGLLQQGMQQSQQPPQQAPQGARQPPQQGGQQGQQQGGERAQFEPIAEKMLGHVYGEGLPRIEKVLSSGDPVDSMGRVIGMVMSTVYNALDQGGKSVQPNVMVRAGMELSKAIGEIAMEMGALPQGEDDAVEMAFLIGLGKFGQAANNMPAEEKQRYAQIARGLKEGKRAAQGQGQGQRRGQEQQRQAPQGQPQQGGM